MKKVYNWDPLTKAFTTIQVVSDDYKLNSYQTFDEIPDGPDDYYPILRINDCWQSIPRDKWLATQPKDDNQLMMQNIQYLQSMIMMQNQQLAQLMAKEGK